MAITFLESGTDATQGLEFYASTAGTVTSSSTVARTGPRSLKFDGTTVNAIAPPGSANVASGRASFWMRWDGSLSSGGNNCNPIGICDGSTSDAMLIDNDTLGADRFQLKNNGTTRVTGTLDTSTLASDTWHHFAIAWTRTSSSVNRFKFWINGTLDIDATNVTWNATGQDQFRIGHMNVSGAPNLTYIDDIYVDDDSSLIRPGDIRVTAKLPVSETTSNWDTDVGTGAVNERPLSVTNGKQHAAATDVQENFTLEGAGEGDANCSDNRIIAHCGWVYGKRGAFTAQTTVGSVSDKSSNHTTTVISVSGATTAGSAIVVCFACDDDTSDTTATCADSQSNTYAAGQSVQVATTGNQTGARAAIFVALNSTALTTSDTITISHGTIDASAAVAREEPGVATSSALDTSATATNASASTHPSGVTATLSQSNNLIVVAFALEGDNVDANGVNRLAGDLVETRGGTEANTTGAGTESNMAINYQAWFSNSTTAWNVEGQSSASRESAIALGVYKMQTEYGTYGDPKIMLDGIETSIALTQSNALYTKIVEAAPYPDNASAIGMRNSGVAIDSFLYECGVLVAYDATPLSVLRHRRTFTVRN